MDVQKDFSLHIKISKRNHMVQALFVFNVIEKNINKDIIKSLLIIGNAL